MRGMPCRGPRTPARISPGVITRSHVLRSLSAQVLMVPRFETLTPADSTSTAATPGLGGRWRAAGAPKRLRQGNHNIPGTTGSWDAADMSQLCATPALAMAQVIKVERARHGTCAVRHINLCRTSHCVDPRYAHVAAVRLPAAVHLAEGPLRRTTPGSSTVTRLLFVVHDGYRRETVHRHRGGITHQWGHR